MDLSTACFQTPNLIKESSLLISDIWPKKNYPGLMMYRKPSSGSLGACNAGYLLLQQHKINKRQCS